MLLRVKRIVCPTDFSAPPMLGSIMLCIGHQALEPSFAWFTFCLRLLIRNGRVRSTQIPKK